MMNWTVPWLQVTYHTLRNRIANHWQNKTPGLMLQCLVWWHGWHGWHGLWFSWLCAPMPSPENSSRLGPRIKKLALSPSTMETWQLGQLSQHGLAGFVHLFAIWVVLHTLDSAAAFYYNYLLSLSQLCAGYAGHFFTKSCPTQVDLCWYDIHLSHPLTFNFSR